MSTKSSELKRRIIRLKKNYIYGKIMNKGKINQWLFFLQLKFLTKFIQIVLVYIEKHFKCIGTSWLRHIVT